MIDVSPYFVNLKTTPRVLCSITESYILRDTKTLPENLKLFDDSNFSHSTFASILRSSKNHVHSRRCSPAVVIPDVPGGGATVRLRLPHKLSRHVGYFHYGIRCQSGNTYRSLKIGRHRVGKNLNHLKLKIASGGIAPKRRESLVRSKKYFRLSYNYRRIWRAAQ